jgi:hypothetical protein
LIELKGQIAGFGLSFLRMPANDDPRQAAFSGATIFMARDYP